MTPVPIHARNPGPMTGAGNWTWLIRGRLPTLIDAGTGDPAHVEEVAGTLGSVGLAQVLVTHAHTDHASGAPALAARFAGARFRKMPWPERDARWPVAWSPVADGDTLEAGDTTLVAVHTPGHAPDHLCFWHEATRTLFCGDLAVEGTTVWIPQSQGGSLADYLASLARVLALEPERLLPAHGPVIDDPGRVLRGYVAHRLRREEEVLAALARGDRTPDAIASRIYAGLKEPFLRLARESVAAHLVKLEHEGRVTRTADGGWER
jgi:glyoxylase-like metal-dependent hydrolase (beta-lactamase superfamily II)